MTRSDRLALARDSRSENGQRQRLGFERAQLLLFSPVLFGMVSGTSELLDSYSDAPLDTVDLRDRTMPEANTSAIQRSYKFRIYPNATQRTKLAQCFGISRWAYNEGLSAIGFAYRTQGQRFTGIDCSRAVTEMAREPDFEWINDAPRTVVTNALRNLDTAFKNFFAGRGEYPRFKKKLNKQTVAFQLDQRQNNWLAGRMLKLPGVGAIKVKWSRTPSGRPKTATVTRTETGKYFVSLSIAETVEMLPATGKACGVDVGIKDLAITHDWKSGAPKNTAKYERDLRIAQRRLSRKTKGSKRWQHARIKVARIHEKIANSRADFIHKASSHLIKSHDYLGIENLNVKGLLKNRKLSKAISDAALSELHRQLKYKAEWYGRDLRQCSQWEPTSKTCHHCGSINADLKLSDREWACECGSIHDRDQNAARNILRAAFGGNVEVTGVDGWLTGHQLSGVGATE